MKNKEKPLIKVLDLSKGLIETAGILNEKFIDSQIEFVSKRIWKQLPPFQLLKEARQVNCQVFVIAVDDVSAIQDERLLVFLGSVTSSNEFCFLETSTGDLKRISRFNCVFLQLPIAGLSLISSLIFLGLFVPVIHILKLIVRSTKQSIEDRYGITKPFNKVAYLRTDMTLNVKAGGSVTHTRGVIKGFKANEKDILVLSNEAAPWLSFNDIQVIFLKRTRLFSFFRETERMVNGISFALRALSKLKEFKPEIIYQRQCQFDFSGLLLSLWFSVPLVLESNASDVKGLYWERKRLQAICAMMERTMMMGSSVIISISEPLRETLEELNYPSDRIHVLLNGVDCDQFDTSKQEAEAILIRKELGLSQDHILVGFVGTFGQWHGIPVLTKAIIKTLGVQKELRYLLVGDGELRYEAERELCEAECSEKVTFTGIVDPSKIGGYLAACDVLVSPHSKSPDGRKFFGSPTKLFEYMAANRAIVASNLDQIGEILVDRETAILVEPDSVDGLVSAIIELSQNDGLRRRLGSNARKIAEERHTWKNNVENVVRLIETNGAAVKRGRGES